MNYADFLRVGYMKNKFKMIYCVLAYGSCMVYLMCNTAYSSLPSIITPGNECSREHSLPGTVR